MTNLRPPLSTLPEPEPGVPEEWRWIPGFRSLYAISDQGRVFSYRSKRLVGFASGHGYREVYLTGEPRPQRVHRLVLQTFVGPCPPGHEARHLNDIKDDNRLSNLAWGTPSENTDDQRRNGVMPRGEARGSAKLSPPPPFCRFDGCAPRDGRSEILPSGMASRVSASNA